MTYSVQNKDQRTITGKLHLFVNGVQEFSAYAFNAEEGWFERWALDPDRPGKVKVDRLKRQLVWERRYEPFVVRYRPEHGGGVFAQSSGA